MLPRATADFGTQMGHGAKVLGQMTYFSMMMVRPGKASRKGDASF